MPEQGLPITIHHHVRGPWIINNNAVVRLSTQLSALHKGSWLPTRHDTGGGGAHPNQLATDPRGHWWRSAPQSARTRSSREIHSARLVSTTDTLYTLTLCCQDSLCVHENKILGVAYTRPAAKVCISMKQAVHVHRDVNRLETSPMAIYNTAYYGLFYHFFFQMCACVRACVRVRAWASPRGHLCRAWGACMRVRVIKQTRRQKVVLNTP